MSKLGMPEGNALGPDWRQGSKVAVNVYEGDRPICQCQREEDAKFIVLAVNLVRGIIYPQLVSMAQKGGDNT